MKPEKIILHQKQCPGDYLTCLGSLESLHIQYPGRYVTGFQCIYPALFDNHPMVTKLNERDPDVRVIEMQCPDIHRSHVPIHFMQCWTSFLGQALAIPLDLQVAHPTIYLSDEEKRLPRLAGHWVINAGYKNDCEAKHWGHSRYQRLVDMLPGVTFHQIGETFHNHKPLVGHNVINHIGQMNGDCRALIRLVSQCDGTISGVTFLQHVAAALQKPAVVINLREPPWFTAYPRQTMFSTMGKMPCSCERACWASAVRPEATGNRCKLPLITADEAVPQCAELISPAHVAAAVKSYAQVS